MDEVTLEDMELEYDLPRVISPLPSEETLKVLVVVWSTKFFRRTLPCRRNLLWILLYGVDNCDWFTIIVFSDRLN
jgi:hypothetical protein